MEIEIVKPDPETAALQKLFDRNATSNQCSISTKLSKGTKNQKVKHNQMNKYKLYKVTKEKEFVVAATADHTLEQVEDSVDNVMIIHNDSLMIEPATHVLAEGIKTLGDLPDEWNGTCLPYLNMKSSDIPMEMVNKTIKDFLEDGAN
jgi:hypothetical protein